MDRAKREQIEYTLLATIIGLCTALEEGQIELAVAEQILFAPQAKSVLEAAGFDDSLLRMIREGSELRDVEGLLPDRYACTVRRIRQQALERLSELPRYDFERPKWLLAHIADEQEVAGASRV